LLLQNDGSARRDTRCPIHWRIENNTRSKLAQSRQAGGVGKRYKSFNELLVRGSVEQQSQCQRRNESGSGNGVQSECQDYGLLCIHFQDYHAYTSQLCSASNDCGGGQWWSKIICRN
jgi:hypothetical protein